MKFLFKSNKQKDDVKQSLDNNQEDMDDLEFDEMNDVWDDMDDL